MNINKKDLIELISKDQDQLPQRDIDLAIKTIINSMLESLASGKRIEIRGFGSFVTKTRAKKIGRNIKKNIAIEIPEHQVPSFKPAKVFIDSVKKISLDELEEYVEG